MIVLHEHAKQMGYCNVGLRKWFASRDVSFSEFRLNGVSSDWLLQQNDAMATRLVEYATQLNESSVAKNNEGE